MSVRTIRVDLAGRGYDIVIGPGLIDRAGPLCRPLLAAPRVTIVSDDTVAPLYGQRLAASFAAAGVAFVGDALFNGGVGRTDLPGGDYAELERSIRTQIYTLPSNTVVYPGHGPATTVGDEKSLNPFVRG